MFADFSISLFDVFSDLFKLFSDLSIWSWHCFGNRLPLFCRFFFSACCLIVGRVRVSSFLAPQNKGGVQNPRILMKKVVVVYASDDEVQKAVIGVDHVNNYEKHTKRNCSMFQEVKVQRYA